MRDHVGIVGVLFILYGVLLLIVTLPLFSLAALPGLGALAGGGAQGAVAPAVSVGLAFLLGASLDGLAVACLWVGQGLRLGARWARPGGLICGVLLLTSPPLGTLIGVYALATLRRPGAGSAAQGAR